MDSQIWGSNWTCRHLNTQVLWLLKQFKGLYMVYGHSGRKDMGWYGILVALPYHGMGWDLGDTYHTNPLLGWYGILALR